MTFGSQYARPLQHDGFFLLTSYKNLHNLSRAHFWTRPTITGRHFLVSAELWSSCRNAVKHSFDANIFIDFGPVYSLTGADKTKPRALLWSGFR
jgi:hypothetical protein